MKSRIDATSPGLGLLLALLAGCGGANPAAAPPTPAARDALVTALDAWQKGQKPGPLPGTPAVHALDTTWQGGRKLTSYEVLGDEPGEGFRTFTVRLSLAKPTGQDEVRYLVMGREPVNVMREDDFRRNASMEDAPPPPPPPPSRRRR